MTCAELTNDILLAPHADAQKHLADCPECRRRQQAVQLAVRALRALADDEVPVPPPNSAAIRAAIPGLAAAARRRRPSGWWTVSAAAAALFAAIVLGLKAGDEGPVPATHGPAHATSGAPGVSRSGDPDPPAVARGIPDPVQPPDPQVPLSADPPEPGGGTPLAAGLPLPPDPVDPVEPVAETPPTPDRPPFTPVPPLPPDPVPAAVAGVLDVSTIMRAVVERERLEGRDFNLDGRCDVADAMLAARVTAEGRLR